MNKPELYLPLSVVVPFQVSEACRTGLYADSWQNALGTSAGKQALKNAGFNPNFSDQKTVELIYQKEKFSASHRVFTFRFLRSE